MFREREPGKETSWVQKVKKAKNAAVIVLALAACSGKDDKPTPPTTESTTTTVAAQDMLAFCVDIPGTFWTAVPSDVDTVEVSEALGIAEERVKIGAYGFVECDTALTLEQAREQVPVEVVGFPSPCLLWGVVSPTQPLEETGYDQFTAVCPGSPPPVAA